MAKRKESQADTGATAMADSANAPCAHVGDGKTSPRFAHPSEAEFAGILDFYQLEWQYEPRSFPLSWDQEGKLLESFTPDFYLPALDLYIELTTLKQSLVTKKNRKLRRLRELYPDVNIKLFYGRDFRRLMVKYGLAEQVREEPRVDGMPQQQRGAPSNR